MILDFFILLPSLLFAWGKTIEFSGTDEWQEALDNHAIADGDHVLLAGSFSCGLEIRNISNLAISASGPGKAIFDCKDQPQRAITVYSDFVQFSLSFLTFRNGITDDSGGAMAFFGDDLLFLNISNCEFVNNTAGGTLLAQGGGGLFVLGSASSYIEIRNCTFRNNVAKAHDCAGGGGLCILYNTTVLGASTNVIGGVFVNNTTPSGGGGVALNYYWDVKNAIVRMIGGDYEMNSGGPGGGGAINIWTEKDAQFMDTAILNGYYGQNYGDQGGAVELWFAYPISNSRFQIQGEEYVENEAIQGGAVSATFWSAALNVSFSLSDCRFDNNSAWLGKAAGGGGGIGIIFEQQNPDQTSDVAVAIDKCSFNGNNATGLGGGILIVLPPGSPLTQNCSSCTQLDGKWYPPVNPECKMYNESMYCSQYSLSQVNYVQNWFVPYAQQGSLKLSNSNFSCNVINGSGGAVAISNGDLHFSEVFFSYNNASQSGGGLYMTGTAESSFSNRIGFANNTASEHTAFLANTLGGILINPNCVIAVEAAVPANFSVAQQSFLALEIFHTGHLLNQGTMEITCPAGFNLTYESSYSNLLFVAGWPNVMKSISANVACSACQAGLYSTKKGYMEISGSTAVKNTSVECLPCPSGADCSFGADVVLAMKDYWGYYNEKNGTWSFTPCPLDLCCQLEAGCYPRSFSACADNKNPAVPLCGECLLGYSQDLRDHKCTKNDDCNDGKWFWPSLVTCSVLWCLLMIRTSSSHISRKRHEEDAADEQRPMNMRDLSWVIPILLFFCQNSYFLFAVQRNFINEIMLVAALSSFHFRDTGRLESAHIQGCILPNLSAKYAIAMMLAAPAVIFTLLLCTYIVFKIIATSKPSKKAIRRVKSIGPAAAKTVLLTYSMIFSACAAFRQCVDVEGIDPTLRVISQSGGDSCDEPWVSLVLAVFVIVIVPFPFLLFAFQVFIRKRGIISNIIRSIEEPYLPNRWYYPSLVLLRRFIIVCIFSFETDASIKGVLFSIWFVVFLIIHLVMLPHKSENGNIIEGLNLSILIWISLCTVIDGSYFEVRTTVQGTHSSSAADVNGALTVIQAVLFAVPLVATTIILINEWIKRRFGLQGPIQSAIRKGSDWLSPLAGIELSPLSPPTSGVDEHQMTLLQIKLLQESEESAKMEWAMERREMKKTLGNLRQKRQELENIWKQMTHHELCLIVSKDQTLK